MKTNKINFFKKIYFSICKIKEYGTLTKEGLKRSAYYITDLIVICSIIYASILTLQAKSNANKLQAYLEQNFPNLKYENKVLTSDVEGRVLLDDKLVEANFGGQIVIDTTVDSENLINDFENVEKPTILFSSDKYITINSQGSVAEYDYSEVIGQKLEEGTFLGKDYFTNMLSNIPYGYYFFGYLIGSSIGTSILVFVYNLLISGIAFVFCKIKKVKVKFSEIYSMGLYAHTIAVFCFFLNIVLPTSVAVYVQLLTWIIPGVYLIYAVYVNKWKIRYCSDDVVNNKEKNTCKK